MKERKIISTVCEGIARKRKFEGIARKRKATIRHHFERQQYTWNTYHISSKFSLLVQKTHKTIKNDVLMDHHMPLQQTLVLHHGS